MTSETDVDAIAAPRISESCAKKVRVGVAVVVAVVVVVVAIELPQAPVEDPQKS